MKRISIVVTGDSIMTMKQSVHSEPEFLEMVEIIRGADIAFTNSEVIFHDYEGYPSPEPGGTYMRADPGLTEEFKWMGFDIVSTANNHTLDYLYGGLLANIKYLKIANIPYSGTGRNLAEAREPAYLETQSGRVALISAASSFASFSRAGPARKDLTGRPGLNPLRYETEYVVEEDSLEAIKKLQNTLALKEEYNDGGIYKFLGRKFVVGDDIGVHTYAHEGDMKGNLESIKEAKRQADWILFSLHAHEGREAHHEKPAEFIEEFARNCIDAGVHGFIGHGPHVLRGIEIRDSRPIFYSLGNFIYQNMTVSKMPAEFYERYALDPYKGTPADAYDARQKTHHAYAGPKAYERWISVIPYMIFEDDKLIELKLYPIDLGMSKPRSQKGRPVLATPEIAKKILELIKTRSEPYDTNISIKDNVGIVIP